MAAISKYKLLKIKRLKTNPSRSTTKINPGMTNT